MRIPDKAVREFQELWKIQFGEELDDPKARAFAEQFLDVMQIVLKPIPQNK
jgi:hypothetical protein